MKNKGNKDKNEEVASPGWEQGIEEGKEGEMQFSNIL